MIIIFEQANILLDSETTAHELRALIKQLESTFYKKARSKSSF